MEKKEIKLITMAVKTDGKETWLDWDIDCEEPEVDKMAIGILLIEDVLAAAKKDMMGHIEDVEEGGYCKICKKQIKESKKNISSQKKKIKSLK